MDYYNETDSNVFTDIYWSSDMDELLVIKSNTEFDHYESDSNVFPYLNWSSDMDEPAPNKLKYTDIQFAIPDSSILHI